MVSHQFCRSMLITMICKRIDPGDSPLITRAPDHTDLFTFQSAVAERKYPSATLDRSDKNAYWEWYTVVLYLRATVIWMDRKRVKFIAIAFALVCAHGPLSRLINRIMVLLYYQSIFAFSIYSATEYVPTTSPKGMEFPSSNTLC